MRQRKIKNLEEKYKLYEEYIINEPSEQIGHWRDNFPEKQRGGKLLVEIGSGKGDFILGKAFKATDDMIIGIEGNRSVLLRTLEKLKENNIKNVRIVPNFVENIGAWFSKGEIDEIFLNFSDPWHKNYQKKRRLTYRDRLKSYFDTLSDKGKITFKTDNDRLFDFSIKEILASDLKIEKITRDLHSSDWNEENIMTEYEKKFHKLEKNINMVEIKNKESAKNGFARANGRTIPKEDKVFGISNRANEAIKKFGKDNVINATIGALLDDAGDLIVLKSVENVIKNLQPHEFATYAPIQGVRNFREAVIKEIFGEDENINMVTRVVATPGGTGALSNAISNYTDIGDKILTHDWFWPNYKSIADQQGRGFETFAMFDEEGRFNLEDFEYKVNKLLRNQERLLIIINTPASNPTGYALSLKDWEGVAKIISDISDSKKITLVVDIAYIDFAGDEKETREFIDVLKTLPKGKVLTLFAYSASKTFTFYGFRCGALVAMSKDEATLDEFQMAASYMARSTWSNSPRAPEEIIGKIYQDEELLREVGNERKIYRDMLLERGKAFVEVAKNIGLEMLPFRGGFFISIPCGEPEKIMKELEKSNVFVVPTARGIRVSVASISKEKCTKLPHIIKEALK